MARTLNEIQNQIFETVANDNILSTQLTSTSKVAVWKLLVFVIAFAIYTHELIVERNAENSRPHNLPWYREQALAFMDGHELIWKDGQFKYDTTGMSEQDIVNAKKVTHVAVTEAANGVLVIKTANNQTGSTQPLATAVHERFQDYMKQIKDAGNRLEYINQNADDLQLTLTVWVDELIIDVASGQLVNDANTYPVLDACEAYLNQLEFNGTFIKTFLIDKIQQAVGVKIPRVEVLEHRTGANPFQVVEEYILPFAGHFKYTSINVTYKKYNEVA